jgi:hypothetical protein
MEGRLSHLEVAEKFGVYSMLEESSWVSVRVDVTYMRGKGLGGVLVTIMRWLVPMSCW